MSRAGCLALVLFALIGGCSPSRLQQTAGQVSAANTECDARFASGEFRTRVDWAHCINDNENRIVQPVNPFPDLLSLKQAHRIVLAEKVDSGKLTLDEAKLAMAQITTQITTEAEKRLTRRALVVSTLLRSPGPPPQPQLTPQPQLNCYSTGASAGVIATCQ
jgi:hypothetical protein